MSFQNLQLVSLADGQSSSTSLIGSIATRLIDFKDLYWIDFVRPTSFSVTAVSVLNFGIS